MKNAEYRYASVSILEFIHQNIWQPPHDPFARSRDAPLATRKGKVSQDFRRLADASSHARCCGRIPLLNIFVDRKQLRPRAGAKAKR